MKTTAEAVIIGGGIQGTSVAYHLARRGMTDVCLVEMNDLGSGSSGRSASLITFSSPPEACLPLTTLSFAAFERFGAELDADPGYVPIGCLRLAGQRAAPRCRRRHQLLKRRGIQSQLMDGAGINDLTPGLNLEDIELGLYVPRDGNLEPHAIVMAYAQNARRLGVQIVQKVRAMGLKIVGGRLRGVHTTAGFVATPRVINAAGSCARQVGTWAGMALPIRNMKRHIFVTGPVALYSQSIPFTYEYDVEWYIRREGPGVLIGMGSVESDEEDPQVDWSFLDVVGEHTMHRAPALADAEIKSGWAGLRPMTPDDNPILSEAPHLPGFFNNCGWDGHGVMHAPAGGLLMAELVLDGKATSADVNPFRAERFEGWLVGGWG
jgi:sarcosine oxidase subunit beta